MRADGPPGIGPVEPVFASGNLLFGAMRSAKRADLERDCRCVLNSLSDPNGTEGEFKLFGRAMLVTDPALRDSGEGWWKSFLPGASSVYSLDIESSALVSWDRTAFELHDLELGRFQRRTAPGYQLPVNSGESPR